MTMISVQTILQEALKRGFLAPAAATELGRLFDQPIELSPVEVAALERLKQALSAGEVISVQRKQYYNIMEELVLTELLAQIVSMKKRDVAMLNMDDAAAYALNRLPPLYATTVEGARFQKEHAQKQLQTTIAKRVAEGIARSVGQPDYHPARKTLGPATQAAAAGILEQISSLLEAHAVTIANANKEP